MGKEWLNWGGSGKSGMRKSSGGDGEAEEVGAPGCMCAVFQIFNVHYFPFALHHHPSQPQPQPQPQPSFRPSTNTVLFQDKPPHVLKGVEAPRNSLDLEEPFTSSSTQILDECLNIQMGIQIKTTCETRSPKSEDFSSPSTKTPNLVARLMGLDLLPQSTSPSLSSSIFHATSNISATISKRNSLFDKHDSCSGTFSLPETPRISSCRRSDVEHHRLSLQLHKDSFLEEELELSSFITKRCDKDKSKGQILRQVRESVRRRFGLDMTNTIKSREQRKDIILVENHQIQLKKPDFVSKENKTVVVETSRRVRKPPQASDDALRSKKEEPFNKGNIASLVKKSTPLSTDLVNISFPANQQLDKQGQKQSSKKKGIQNSSHHSYHHHQQLTPTFQNNIQEKNIHDSKQNHYIQTILKHTAIQINKWYNSTTSYPPPLVLDPSLFHFLEVFYHNTPDPSCQRKLIFHLVDELLVEILKPIVKEHVKIKGSDLVEILCKKVGSFPLANCQVIEDIDALIYEDFRRCKKMGKWDAFDEEGEGECIVMVIEDYIVDLLVHETAAIVALMDGDTVRHCKRRLY